MESRSSFIARQLRYFTATLYAQIKLSTRDGVNDIAKTQETSLLGLINMAYGKNFIDLNQVQFNFKGLDYGDYSSQSGLQMTATVTKFKFQNTAKKIINDENLKQTFPIVYIFVLTVEALPNSVLHYPTEIQLSYITLFDLISEVLTKDLDFQVKFLEKLKLEYNTYFNTQNTFNPYTYTTCITLPQDLLLFNDLIGTDEWFPLNNGEGYMQVYNFIDLFRERLSNCSYSAKQLLSSILKCIPLPKSVDTKITIYLDVVYARLNIKPEYELNFKDDLKFLEVNDLIELLDEYQGYRVEGEDVIFDNRKYIQLNFNKYEPAVNMYAALILFYSSHHTMNDLEQAILSNDFSLLSDSQCNKSNL